MNTATMVSTAFFVISVNLYFYMRFRIAEKHNGLGKFARLGYRNLIYIDAKKSESNQDFVREWNKKIPKYHVIFIFGILQFLIILSLDLFFGD